MTIALLTFLLTATSHASPERRPKMLPYVQLQTWATAWDQDESVQADPGGYGDPEHDPGFLLQRARMGFKGNYDALDFAVSVGTGAAYDALSSDTESIGIVDAYGRYKLTQSFGSFFASAGSQRVPFSREMLMPSSELTFQERSVGANWLNPLRDMGLVAGQTVMLGEGGESQVTLRGGMFNGNGKILGDTDPGVMVSGRLEYTLGDTYKTATTDDAVGVGVAAFHNTELANSTTAIGVDGLGRLNGLTVQFEGTFQALKPTHPDLDAPSVLANTTRFGAMAQVSYFAPVGKTGIEPAYRVATFDDATDFDDNGDVALMHAGVNWRNVVRGLDVGTAFVHRIERSGAQQKNDTFRFTAQIVYPPRK
jgi:hypothetical protein